MRFNFFKISLIIFLLNTHLCLADSPLTSIDFWNISKDAYIIKIGNKTGKQKLDKQMFKYLMNPNNSSFEKFALINALKWEFKSDITNSKKFIEYLKTENYNKDELDKVNWDNTNSLNLFLIQTGEEYYMLYQYMLAMDNYLDVSDIKKSISENLQIQEDPLYHFIYSLVSCQEMVVNNDFCEVYNTFSLFLAVGCIDDEQLKYSAKLANSYISLYSKSCKQITIDLGSLCNISEYTLNNYQGLYIINYPYFVYGTLKVYDKKNNLILEKKSDGDDLFEIEKGLLEKGNYTMILNEDKTLKVFEFKLKII